MGVRGAGAVKRLAFAAAIGAATQGCAVGAVTPSAETVPLRFRGTPADASVTIDDLRIGPLSLVAARGIRVLPGRHRITVEAPGYLPLDVAIEAKDAVVPIEVKLVAVPD